MMLNNFAISFSLLFYCLCCPLPGVAQDRFLGKYCLGEDADPSSIVELPDGYVVTGGTCYNAETDDELIAFKVDKQGNFRWRCGIKPLNPWFVGCSIVAYEGGLAPDGTVMIGGGLAKAGPGGALFLAKVDPDDGHVIWLKLYKEFAFFELFYSPEHLTMCPNGDMLLSGVYTPDRVGDRDSMFVLRISPSGELLHEAMFTGFARGRYEPPLNGNPVVLPNGDIFIGFFQHSINGSIAPVPQVALLGPTLEVKWVRHAKAQGAIMRLDNSKDGNVYTYLEGGRVGDSGASDHPCLQKWTPDGDTLWMVQTEKYGYRIFFDLDVLNNGTLVLCTGQTTTASRLDFFTPEGRRIRRRIFTVPYYYPIIPGMERYETIKMRAIKATSDGGLVAAAYYSVVGSTTPLTDCFLVWKMDSLGCIEAGCAGDTTQVVTGVFSPPREPAPAFDLFPNPAHNLLHLTFSVGLPTGEYTLVIADALGRAVSPLRRLTAPFTTDIGALLPGIYVATVFIDGRRLGTRRFVKQ